MDAAHLLITALPGRRVSMLAGPGTMFAGARRSSPPVRSAGGAAPGQRMARQVANRFDGTNEGEVRAWFR